MSDFEEKLNAILSNPQAMSQVMSLAQSLDLGGGAGNQPPPPSPSQQASPAEGPKVTMTEPENGGNGLGALGDLLGGLDPKLIAKLLPLVGELTGGGGNDERLQLLYALGPFLKPERREKIQQAAQTARLIHVGKKLLSTLGDSHV